MTSSKTWWQINEVSRVLGGFCSKVLTVCWLSRVQSALINVITLLKHSSTIFADAWCQRLSARSRDIWIHTFNLNVICIINIININQSINTHLKLLMFCIFVLSSFQSVSSFKSRSPPSPVSSPKPSSPVSYWPRPFPSQDNLSSVFGSVPDCGWPGSLFLCVFDLRP